MQELELEPQLYDEIQRFLIERKEAFLSMDKEAILAFSRKWDTPLHLVKNEETFWGAVHMARTGDLSLPMQERAASKRWLKEKGWRSMDDGDVPDIEEVQDVET